MRPGVIKSGSLLVRTLTGNQNRKPGQSRSRVSEVCETRARCRSRALFSSKIGFAQSRTGPQSRKEFEGLSWRHYPVGYPGAENPKKSFALEQNTSIVANRRRGANRRTGLPTSINALEVLYSEVLLVSPI